MAQSILSYGNGPSNEPNRLLASPFKAAEASQQTTTVTSEISQRKFDLETLQQIDQAIEKGKLNLAQELLFHIRLEEGSAELMEYRQFLRLKTAFFLGNAKEAVSFGSQYLESFAGGQHFREAFFYQSVALYKLNRPLVLTELITKDLFIGLSPSQADQLRNVLIQDALAKNDVFGALNLIENDQGHILPGYEAWFANIISRIDNLADIDELLQKYHHPTMLSEIRLRKVHLWVRDGEFEKAKAYLGELLEEEAQNPKMLAELQALNNFIDNNQEVKPYRLGVLLPLSDRRYKAQSEKILEGLELAVLELSRPDQPIELIIKDSTIELSAAEQQQGVAYAQQKNHDVIGQMVRELVIKDRVIAILGPMTKDQSHAAGETADALKIPIISYTLTEDIGLEHPYLFRYQRNINNEAKAMANYAMDYLGARRFVLFYPTHSQGLKQMSAFMNQVKAKGGEVVGMAEVRPNQADFQDPFRAITGGFQKLTPEELKEIQAVREEGNLVVDFDAIYAPLEPEQVNLIKEFAALYDADKAWILSGYQVNEPENLLIKSPETLRFLDTYSYSSSLTYLKPFYEAHWRAFNHKLGYTKPTSYTLFSYESVQILMQILSEEKNHSREAVRTALLELKDVPVLTGHVTTGTAQEIEKDLKILKISSGGITQELF